MDGATLGDSLQGPSEISSHSGGECNVKNIQDSNVAVTASKMKDPQPSVEGIQSGLRKAAEGSDWYISLMNNNCKALLDLLQENSCLVVETAFGGCTVLHVAAECGCIQLVVHVWDLFKQTGEFVDEQSGINITWWELLDAKYYIQEARAADYALHTSPILFEFLSEQDWFTNIGYNFKIGDPIQSSSDANEHLRDEVVKIMQEKSTNEAFEGIREDYEVGTLGGELEELRFHYAVKRMNEKYVADVITKCLELGKPQSADVLTYLFQLQNMAGRTPLHYVLHPQLETVMNLIPKEDDYKNCFNAVDVKGWTILHRAAASGSCDVLAVLLKDERVDVNTRTVHLTGFDNERCDNTETTEDRRSLGKTALHLAILHDDVKSVKLLLNCPRTDVSALLQRDITCGYRRLKEDDFFRILWEGNNLSYWFSPLQLAAIMGSSNIVRILLEEKLQDIFDDGKYSNDIAPGKNLRRISALLLASASGNPDTLRLFLDDPMFNPLVKFEGATALHYASDARMPFCIASGGWRFSFLRSIWKRPILVSNGQVNVFLFDHDFADVNSKFKFKRFRDFESDIEKKATPTSYLANQACITMLLQAGVDIWDKDDQGRGRFAEPGPEATQEARLWWYDRIAQETSEAKKSLNDAANAISVVAALVATASFVGPLQPPLGYGQDTNLSVRVFMVSNNFSFYLAIASIMFAVAPSLPMPQEGIYAEWQRTQRAVEMAIFFLLMSVLGVLISFAAASNSVVSEEYSWNHGGLSFYPALIGGLICMISISLFFLRLLRLVFNKNEKIRRLYKTFVKF